MVLVATAILLSLWKIKFIDQKNLFPQRGLRIFPLSHACDKVKIIFLYFFTELNYLPSFLLY